MDALRRSVSAPERPGVQRLPDGRLLGWAEWAPTTVRRCCSPRAPRPVADWASVPTHWEDSVCG